MVCSQGCQAIELHLISGALITLNNTFHGNLGIIEKAIIIIK